MKSFELSTVKKINIINSQGEIIHTFGRVYLDEMCIRGGSIQHKYDGMITALPLEPKTIRKYRPMNCFIYQNELYILNIFIEFQWIASRTYYGKNSMCATKVFSMTIDNNTFMVNDSYNYRSVDMPKDYVVNYMINELADLDIAIGHKTLGKIMEYYELKRK